MVCALYTHTPTTTHLLIFAHICALTCAHAHIHISHPKGVNMHRLLFYAIWHLLGKLELYSSNSMQFNLNWIGEFEFKFINSIPNSMPFELRWINAFKRQTALNCSELCLMHLHDAPNTYLNSFKIFFNLFEN